MVGDPQRDTDKHDIVRSPRRELARRSAALAARGLRDLARHAPRDLPPMLTLDCGGGVMMELVLIPAGTFTMGSNDGEENEKPPHKVTISKAFYLGKYQVTQAQWEAVMGNNPSGFSHAGGYSDWVAGMDTSQHPVECVSWDECQDFCKRLSARTGKTVRLPTEAEWEYVCRAGTTGSYAGTGKLEDMGWCADDSGERRFDSQRIWDADNSDHGRYGEFIQANRCKTHPVGLKVPNGWGIYDMHGNVYEWCSNRYDTKRRVRRGGAWFNIPKLCRCASRSKGRHNDRSLNCGLRVAAKID